MSIYKDLPNDLIIRIIKEADGGLSTHKKNMKETLSIIERCRRAADEYIIEEYLSGMKNQNTKVWPSKIKLVGTSPELGRFLGIPVHERGPTEPLFEYNEWMMQFLELIYPYMEEVYKGGHDSWWLN
tara:strand:- start:255 stop:635 length:381 start_codon:yes stop_codon:yes gene_type:complete